MPWLLLLDESGRSRQADGYYREVLRHVPQDPEVHEAYARSLGKSGDQYRAYIHLAYSALYANEKKQAERYLRQAKAMADKGGDRREFEKLQAAYNERKEIWDKS